jgi:8-oxo-dGTP diphosphatase
MLARVRILARKQVTAAVIREKDKILITQRAPDDRLALKWEFPGGKIEMGETPEACLIREIREELCLDIIVEKHCMTSLYAYDNGEIELMAYFARISGGELRLCVHANARWVTAEDLSGFDFAPADIPIVSVLQEL